MNRSPTPRGAGSRATTSSPPSPARRAADDDTLRVELQREIELAPVRVRFREWPGYGGPLIVVDAEAEAQAAAALAPRYRVLSLEAAEVAPAVRAAHVAELLEMFGFVNVVLIGGAVAALVAEQRQLAGLVLIDGAAPPQAVACPVLRLPAGPLTSDALETFAAECTGCRRLE